MIRYIIISLTAYLLGSLPTAYLILKKSKGIDIRKSGSGNVGAMNSFEVSKSKLTGFLVFAVDFLKGLLAVMIAGIISPNDFFIFAAAIIFAVIGHCFSIWINFKGGRGLATALGGAVYFSFPIPIIWILLWLAAFIFKKNVHFGNISAAFLTGILAFTNGAAINKYSSVQAENPIYFSITVSMVMLIILIKHFETIKKWLNFNNSENKK